MKNLPFILAVIFTVGFSGQAEARLGWTMQECTAKYGPASVAVPTGKTFKESSVEATFTYEGWRIQVAWFPGTDKAQFIKYTAIAPKMTTEQLDAILASNSDGLTWKPSFDGQNKAGVAMASRLSGSDMRSGYFQREDGARTGTIMLWAINNVSIKSAWLCAKEDQREATQEARQKHVPNF